MAVDSYCVALFLMHNIETRGTARRDGSLRPAVLSLATFQNTLRLHLQALGLERRARDVNNLGSYLAQRRSGAQPGAGDGNDGRSDPVPEPEEGRSAGSVAHSRQEPEGRSGTGARGAEPDV